MSVKLAAKSSGVVHKKPSSFYNGQDRLAYADVNLTIQGQKKQILLFNQSKGLFKLNNGKIVHLTYIEDQQSTKRTFGAEIYDNKMVPVGYEVIKEKKFVPSQHRLLDWNITWKGNKDRFYIIDRNNIPQIQVVKLEMEDG